MHSPAPVNAYAPVLSAQPPLPPRDGERQGGLGDKARSFGSLPNEYFAEYGPAAGLYLHLRYQERRNYSLTAAMLDLYRTVHLSQIVYLLAAGEAGRDRLLSTEVVDENARREWLALGESLVVERLSKQSPLELVMGLTFGGGFVSAAAFGNRLLTLFNNVQDSRRKKSDTDVAVRANQIILRELNSGDRRISQKRLDELGLGARTPRISAAADALEALEALEALRSSTNCRRARGSLSSFSRLALVARRCRAR